jgi:hypothetical protein
MTPTEGLLTVVGVIGCVGGILGTALALLAGNGTVAMYTAVGGSLCAVLLFLVHQHANTPPFEG